MVTMGKEQFCKRSKSLVLYIIYHSQGSRCDYKCDLRLKCKLRSLSQCKQCNCNSTKGALHYTLQFRNEQEFSAKLFLHFFIFVSYFMSIQGNNIMNLLKQSLDKHAFQYQNIYFPLPPGNNPKGKVCLNIVLEA